MTHHFHTWIGHHRLQTLTPLRSFEMCWRRLQAVDRLSHHQCKILGEINATFYGNESCDIVEAC